MKPLHSIFRSTLALACLLVPGALRATDAATPTAVLVRGAGGSEQYDEIFGRWLADWQKACTAGQVPAKVITADAAQPEAHAREALRQSLEAEPKEGAPLWLVLLGHGTSDGRLAKFNLRAEDVTADEVATWLQPFRRPVVVIAGFSTSGAWLKPLAGPQRVILTATKSGTENNFARLGGYLGATFASGADLDKDGQTSLLEAWLAAARQTADFYKNEGRIATEHSLLDDTGDGLGTPADWFTGLRATKKPQTKTEPDGLRASQLVLIPSASERALSPDQRTRRDTLERDLAALRTRKAEMKEDEYFTALEALLLKLAQLYRESGS